MFEPVTSGSAKRAYEVGKGCQCLLSPQVLHCGKGCVGITHKYKQAAGRHTIVRASFYASWGLAVLVACISVPSQNGVTTNRQGPSADVVEAFPAGGTRRARWWNADADGSGALNGSLHVVAAAYSQYRESNSCNIASKRSYFRLVRPTIASLGYPMQLTAG